MTIVEFEKQIGKGLRDWTIEDRKAFVRTLDGTEPVYPPLLLLALAHPDCMTEAFEKAVILPTGHTKEELVHTMELRNLLKTGG